MSRTSEHSEHDISRQLERLSAVVNVTPGTPVRDAVTVLDAGELRELHAELEDVERAQRVAESDAETLFFG